MNRKALLMMATASTLLAGCASGTVTGAPADFNFTKLAPLELNVGAVQVQSQAAAPENPRVNPGLALQRYAKKRLQAVGGEGTLNFNIQQASLTAVEGQGQGNWTDAFSLSKPMEYTVTMRIGLDLVGRSTRPDVKSAFTLERKKTLAEGVSLAERDYQLNKLVESMTYDVDKAVERSLAENMKILVRAGAITFGTPAPLETTGTVVMPAPVQNNAATVARPTVIQGMMD